MKLDLFIGGVIEGLLLGTGLLVGRVFGLPAWAAAVLGLVILIVAAWPAPPTDEPKAANPYLKTGPGGRFRREYR